MEALSLNRARKINFVKTQSIWKGASRKRIMKKGETGVMELLKAGKRVKL